MIGYQYLLEIDALDSGDNPVTLRYCCDSGQGDFTGGGYDWEPRIIDPGLFQVNLFSKGKLTGASTYGYGEIILGNFKKFSEVSGPVDVLKAYSFFGRPVRMYYGPMNASFPAGFTLGYTAAIENVTFSWTQASFTLRSRQAELDIPYDGGKFLGDNVPPDGLEGDANLKDQPKPILIGRVFNCSPVLCNAQKLIYAVSPLTGLSCQEFNSDIHVYDNGVELFCQGGVSNIETLEPEPGCYYASASGYIRLGSTPFGALTASCVSDNMALTSHPSNLISQTLTTAGFSSMIDAASFTSYKTSDKYERGLYLDSQVNISEIIDLLLAPCGYWYFNKSGKMVLGVVSDPSGMTSSFTASSLTNISSFTRSPTTDTKGGVPAKAVTLKYGKNYTPLKQVSGSVSVDQKTRFADQWLALSADSIYEANPFAEEMIIETALTGRGVALLNLVRSLHSPKRELISIELLPEVFLSAVALLPGQCVTVDLDGRFGYTAKKTLIVGITTNFVTEVVTLLLWS